MASNTIEIVIKAKDETSGVLGGVQKALGGLGNIAGTVVKAGMVAGAAGVAAFTAGLGLSIKEALEAQEVQSQLAAVLKSTGGAAGVTADMANDLANKYMGMTRFSDEAVLSAENMLLTFTNIGKDVFPQATETTLNMSQALGQDLKSSSIQLGKALNDPINGMTALQRVGVQFTDDQKKLIEQLVRSGDVMGAQKVILDELQKEFGGSAVAAGQTFAGQLDILRNSLLNVAEGIGMALLPLLQSLVSSFVKNVVPVIQRAGELFGYFMEAVQDAGLFSTEAAEVIEAAFGKKAAAAFLKFGDVVNQVRDWVVNIALPALRSFADWFINDALPAVGKFVAAIWDQLGPGLAQLGAWIKEIAAVILPLLSQAIQFVVDHWQVFAAIAGVVVVAILALTSPITLVIAAVVALATAWANNWGGIQEKTRAVTEAIKGIIGPFLEAIKAWWAENGATIMESVRSTWENIKTIVNGVIEFVKGIVQAGLALVKTIWDQHGTEIKAAATAAWEMIKTVISSALTIIQNVIKAVAALIKGDWQSFGDALKAIWDALWKAIGAILEAAKTALQASIGVIRTVIETAWTALKNNLKAWWAEAWDTIKTKVATITADIKGAINGLRIQVEVAWTAFKENLKKWWSEAWDTISKKVGEIRGTVETAVGGLRQTLETKWQALKDNLKNWWAEAWDAVAKKISEIKTTILGHLQPIIDMIGRIIVAIGNLTKFDWSSLGHSIPQGLANGINSGANAAVTAATNTANKVIGAVKDKLKTHSPSEVFEDIGLDVCEGFVMGIRKGEDSVHKSAVAMVERFERGFRETRPKVESAVDDTIAYLIKGFMSAGTAVGKTAYEAGSRIIGQMAQGVRETQPRVDYETGKTMRGVIDILIEAQTSVGDLGFNTMAGVIEQMVSGITTNAPGVNSAYNRSIDQIIETLTAARDALKELGYDAMVDVFDEMIDGVKDGSSDLTITWDSEIGKLVEGFMSGGQAVQDAVNDALSPVLTPQLPGTGQQVPAPIQEPVTPTPAPAPPTGTRPVPVEPGPIGSYALGGPVWQGLASLVGERAFTRPELFVPSRNGYILTRQQSQEALGRAFSGGLPQRTTNVTLNVYTSAAAEPLLADYNTLKAWAKG